MPARWRKPPPGSGRPVTQKPPWNRVWKNLLTDRQRNSIGMTIRRSPLRLIRRRGRLRPSTTRADIWRTTELLYRKNSIIYRLPQLEKARLRRIRRCSASCGIRATLLMAACIYRLESRLLEIGPFIAAKICLFLILLNRLQQSAALPLKTVQNYATQL